MIDVDIEQALARMANALADLEDQRPLLVGIHTGGAWIAERLHQRLGLTEPLGGLDISFYRDDFSRVGMNPQVKTSHLPVAIDGRHLVLIDDVLHTGRTVRAAMNEIFDYGRPASVVLAVLLVRDGRELPIQPDIIGTTVTLRPTEHIKLTGPHPLGIKIIEKTD